MKWFFMLILLLPLVSAYDVDITLNSNDIVAEYFSINVPDNYDAYEFFVPSKPLGITYDGKYSFADNKITFYSDGRDVLEFTLLYNDMVTSSGNKKSFRASFDNADNIRLSLPEKNILSQNPATIPEPNSKTTDGTHIILSWANTSSIAVFYEGERANLFVIILIFVILTCIVLAAFFLFSKKKIHDKISELLSEDENSVLSEIRKGTIKQKEIAKNLSFSKSKMSKVIRKLEEKNLIEKKPHFKTNIIKLK